MFRGTTAESIRLGGDTPGAAYIQDHPEVPPEDESAKVEKELKLEAEEAE